MVMNNEYQELNEKLDVLKDHVVKLKSLLDNPHPGLWTWCEFYRKHMTAIKTIFGTINPAQQMNNYVVQQIEMKANDADIGPRLHSALLTYPGAKIYVYATVDLSHPEVGHLQFLVCGGRGNTFAEPPPRLPDTPEQINWRHWLQGHLEVSTQGPFIFIPKVSTQGPFIFIPKEK